MKRKISTRVLIVLLVALAAATIWAFALDPAAAHAQGDGGSSDQAVLDLKAYLLPGTPTERLEVFVEQTGSLEGLTLKIGANFGYEMSGRVAGRHTSILFYTQTAPLDGSPSAVSMGSGVALLQPGTTVQLVDATDPDAPTVLDEFMVPQPPRQPRPEVTCQGVVIDGNTTYLHEGEWNPSGTLVCEYDPSSNKGVVVTGANAQILADAEAEALERIEQNRLDNLPVQFGFVVSGTEQNPSALEAEAEAAAEPATDEVQIEVVEASPAAQAECEVVHDLSTGTFISVSPSCTPQQVMDIIMTDALEAIDAQPGVQVEVIGTPQVVLQGGGSASPNDVLIEIVETAQPNAAAQAAQQAPTTVQIQATPVPVEIGFANIVTVQVDGVDRVQSREFGTDIYAEANSDSSVVSFLPAWTMADVQARTSDANWIQVVYRGVTGWVPLENVITLVDFS
ncbi:hypothetical protein C4579_01080 [Candidatus Microgenomates bacterium]|nr:MAG: hypothetical protein C4579_01080 [Candidatus Microgenomates bacterium]